MCKGGHTAVFHQMMIHAALFVHNISPQISDWKSMDLMS